MRGPVLPYLLNDAGTLEDEGRREALRKHRRAVGGGGGAGPAAPRVHHRLGQPRDGHKGHEALVVGLVRRVAPV